jgi:ligand-binding sensor domain-containing protein
MPRFRLPHPWSARVGICVAFALASGLLLACLWSVGAVPTALAHPRGQAAPADGATDGRAVFTRQDGLASNVVTALWRDDTGLWIGTNAGLNRYALSGRQAGLVWQTFGRKDGMAADAVSDLWSDDAGGLWVAHPDRRISYFDGTLWTTYESPTETLSQAYKQIVDTRAGGPLWWTEESGRVWTLSGGTVGYFVGAVWRPYGEDAGIPRGQLVAVWTGDGAWVVSENGQIGYFDGADWTVFRNPYDAVQAEYERIAAAGPMSGPIWLVDQEGAVWVRNAFNQRNPRPDVRRFAEGGWTNYSDADGMATGFVEELRLDQYGRVWARHAADQEGSGGGLSLYLGETEGSTASPWTAILPTVGSNVTDFWPEGRQGVWIASDGPGGAEQTAGLGAALGGLTFVNMNTWGRFSLDQLNGAAIGDTWLDENNTLWLGLVGDAQRGLGGGLWRYRPAQGALSALWAPVSALDGSDVNDLWGDGSGNLWIATGDGVRRLTLSNRRLISYTQTSSVDRVAGDNGGNVWAMALGDEGGVWGWDGDVWASYTVSEGLSGGPYRDMLVTGDGRVYLAGDRGLNTWDGDEWEIFGALPGRYARRIWQDGWGDLWVTTEITPGRPFNLSANQGNAWETILNESESRGMGAEPLNLLRDPVGNVWLGTPAGLYVHDLQDATPWQALGPAEGVASGSVPALYQDDAGTIWAAVGERVYRADHRSCRGTGGCGDWYEFDPGVGVVSNIGPGPAGGIVIAGTDGVALYHPGPPELRLEGIVDLSSEKVSDGNEPVVLTVGGNAIRIDLVTVAPTLSPRQISYRYLLEGVDKAWHFVPAGVLGGKQASITYAGLAGGAYTLTVAAHNDALDYSPPISFPVYVTSRPPDLMLARVEIAGRPRQGMGVLQAYVEQPIQIQLSSADDQARPLTYRYQIQGLNDLWTTTRRSEISFTLSSAGIYTFVAEALDGEGQSSPAVGSQIVVQEIPVAQEPGGFPMQTIAIGLGILAVLFIGAAGLITVRRRRRVSW